MQTAILIVLCLCLMFLIILVFRVNRLPEEVYYKIREYARVNRKRKTSVKSEAESVLNPESKEQEIVINDIVSDRPLEVKGGTN